jgi:uncharacterized protein
MNDTTRIIKAPEVSPETKAFWQACNAEVLSVGRCKTCAAAHYYPRALCPFCLSFDTVLEPVSGDARIYSYSVMRSAPEPYAIAFVTLAEGPTIMTNIVDCGFSPPAPSRLIDHRLWYRDDFCASHEMTGAKIILFTTA